MTGFEMDPILVEAAESLRRPRHAVREWPVRQARLLPVPDARQPIDRWERDVSLVLGVIAIFLGIAAMAILLNPVRP